MPAVYRVYMTNDMLAKYLLILIIFTPIQLTTNKGKVGCIAIYLLIYYLISSRS